MMDANENKTLEGNSITYGYDVNGNKYHSMNVIGIFGNTDKNTESLDIIAASSQNISNIAQHVTKKEKGCSVSNKGGNASPNLITEILDSRR